MNPEQLLKHFNRISEAPDALVRLRRFILDLAVRGKLVEQDPGDEPAAELLKRIQVEKDRLGLTPRRKGAKKSEKADQETLGDLAPWREMLFSIPANWEWVQIRQITSDQGQKVPDGDFTYIDVSAINKEAGCISDAKVIAAREAPSRARKIVRKGDVLYSCVRPYLLNIAIVEDEITPPPIASTAFAILNGFGLVLPKCLWIVLRSSFMIECVEAKMRGQAYPAINDSDFAVLPFPLPPLAEQHRIVAKVDELMALCDQLQAAQTEREQSRDRLVAASLHQLQDSNGFTPRHKDAKRGEKAEQENLGVLAPWRESVFLQNFSRLTTRPAHIKQLRQTILNLAVRGKLVAQDPNDEPAAELLKRIQAEKEKQGFTPRRKGAKKNEKADQETLGDLAAWREMPFALPNGWAWARLGQISLFVTSGSRDWAKYYSEEGAIFIRMGNLSKNHYRMRLAQIQRVKPPANGEGARTRLEPWDLLISITGDVGMLGLIPEGFGEAYINQHTAMVRPMKEMKGLYLAELFRSPFAHDQFNAPQRGIKNSFRLSDVTEFLVPLPPLAEQHRIVAKVDELMALCDQLETQLNIIEADSRRLLEAVLHETLSPTQEEAA